jgi:hypothetical protein
MFELRSDHPCSASGQLISSQGGFTGGYDKEEKHSPSQRSEASYQQARWRNEEWRRKKALIVGAIPSRQKIDLEKVRANRAATTFASSPSASS